MEQWRQIQEAPDYEVSSLGRVRRSTPDRLGRECRILAAPLNDKGYPNLNLHVHGKQLLRRVHGLVCTAFHGDKPASADLVRHLDGNKTNNRASNLAWGTYSENALDNTRLGKPGGPRIRRRVRLAKDVVEELRHSTESQTVLAKRHGICTATIYLIRKGAIHREAA